MPGKLFENGVFNPQRISDPRTTKVLNAAIERSTDHVRPSDILGAALKNADVQIMDVVMQALVPGTSPAELLDLINVFNRPRNGPHVEFDGQEKWFTKEALNGLRQFDSELENLDIKSPVTLELLLVHVLSNMDPKQMNLGVVFNAEKAEGLFRKRIESAAKLLPPLFDIISNRLRSDEFAEDAWTMLEYAAERASSMGYDQILPPHCFLALLAETEGITENLVRLQLTIDVGPGKVADLVLEAFRLGERKRGEINLIHDSFGESTIQLLAAAQRKALDLEEEQISSYHILAALLDTPPPRLRSVLEQRPLNINLQKMRQQFVLQARDAKSQNRKQIAFHLPTGLLPSEDLTYKSRNGTLLEGLHFDVYFEDITKALYKRKNNNVLITGQRGVGKTSLVSEVARRSATGQIPFLKRKRFLWVDCQNVSPKESAGKLEGIISYVASRTDLILCLDGLDRLIRTESSGDNKIILRSALKDKRINIIGVMSNWSFDDLLASDYELLNLFTKVEVAEPKKDAAIDIVKQASHELERDYKLLIQEKAVERAVVLSANYIMSERLPTKAIDILRRACEDLDYERTQAGKTGQLVFNWEEIPGNQNGRLLEFVKRNLGVDFSGQSELKKTSDGQIISLLSDTASFTINLNVQKKEATLSAKDVLVYKFDVKVDDTGTQVYETISVTPNDVIRIISKVSGVPEGTLSGLGEKEADYKKSLSLEVIGQEEAVKTVADRLRLIKSGGAEPGKPAAVMFFAGLTGTGKTELAKALATFYSSSKRLQIYTMGNFTQPHSISGIIGVPPGYVGYDQGGRLINDLNSDPYCVFLLDEAEKTHPDIWKPFLNLFDAGWVVDQRGVKAFGERAIFILTSNAGNEIISRMSISNEPLIKITEKVKEALLNIRHDGTTEPVFSPEFLARMGNIVVFKPLDEAALLGICKKMAARTIRNWLEKKEKKLIIPGNLIEYIAHQSHVDDKKTGYKEGGRIVGKKIVEFVELPIQQEIVNHNTEYESCSIVELTFLDLNLKLPSGIAVEPKVQVTFRRETARPPMESLKEVASNLKQSLENSKDTSNSIQTEVANSLKKLETEVDQWTKEHPQEIVNTPIGLELFRKACSDLLLETSRSEKESQEILSRLIASLEGATA